MKVRLDSCAQSRDIEDKLKTKMYRGLHERSNARWVKLSGPLVGIASGVMTVGTRICLIGESAFKGLINIGGAPFHPACSFGSGLSMLILGTTKSVVILPFSIGSAAVGLAAKPIFMFKNPGSYTHSRWCAHDANENRLSSERAAAAAQEARRRAAEAERNKARNHFLAFHQLVQQQPNNTAALVELASCYESGYGVFQDKTQAFDLFLRAANLGNVLAMATVGRFYHEGLHARSNKTEAFNWLLRAAQNGHAASMSGVASLYYMGTGTAQDYTQALAWYQRAAASNEVVPHKIIARMYAMGQGTPRNIEESIKWFKRGANAGDAACRAYVCNMLLVYPQYGRPNEWIEWNDGASSGRSEAIDFVTAIRTL